MALIAAHPIEPGQEEVMVRNTSFVLALAFVWVGCVPQSHEVLFEDDGGAPVEGGPWVELTGAGRQQFGESLAFGDLDGDGLDDAILANRTGADGRVGSVVILYGRPNRLNGTYALSGADVEILGPVRDDGGGIWVDVGDFDGDGVDDLLVGAHSNLGSGTSVHVLYGGTRWSGTPPIEALGPVFAPGLHTFGGWVRTAGDVDGDGCDEMLMGSPRAAAYLVRGRSARWTGTVPFEPDVVFAGTGPTETSVFCFDGAGDLDGDGLGDLLVGERIEGLLHLGIYYGGSHLVGTLSIADAQAMMDIPNAECRLRGRFDLNGDGLSDFVVAEGLPAGSLIRGYFGDSVRFHGSLSASDAAAFALSGVHYHDRAGAELSAGDVDGDGRDDLLIGSPNFNADHRDLGRAYRFLSPRSGSVTDADMIWQGRVLPLPANPDITYAEKLGSAVAQDGDFDGDGHADALLGGHSDYNPQGGRVIRLVYGP